VAQILPVIKKKTSIFRDLAHETCRNYNLATKSSQIMMIINQIAALFLCVTCLPARKPLSFSRLLKVIFS